ncbi:MAG: 1-(5-phosphoribosyl)-5-[Kiritimatiellae bacterium]|nr:1-(5-phosphoribosyl)-5-[(5-phosphoribosylamino)methylideneamino]imidazole-4-carboxamide isomerase [Kiritimatiellia bacterium]
MKIIPAIDVMGGRCVRLRQGKAEDETVYGDDPAEMALRWQAEGAEFLHIVDLDGAFRGAPAIIPLVRTLADSLSIPFEVGGGIRTDADAEAVLDAGAARIIVGSRAVSDRDAVARLAGRVGQGRVVVGIDARDGLVQVSGWTETTQVEATALARDLAQRGIRVFAFTDTATDGMLSGPNVRAMERMADAIAPCGATLVASGGVGSCDHVRALARAGRSNIEGVIVGKALYERVAPLGAFIEAAGVRGEAPGEASP